MQNTHPSKQTIRLLIVEDDPDDRDLYRHLLSRSSSSSYHVIEAQTGEEGLALYGEARPDCVLLDYSLPDMTGLELLSQMKCAQEGSPCPIVMLTGRGDESLAVDAMKLGAIDYLTKRHLSQESLEGAIHYTLHQCQLQWELVQREKGLEEFVYLAVHDLKSPLTRISNYCQLLNRRYREQLDDRGQRYIDESLEGTRHMAAVINALLDYAHAGNSKEPFQPVSLHEVVRKAISQLEDKIAKSQAKIVVKSELPEVCGDLIQLVRLFQNLLSNALKFRHPDRAPVVEIECSIRGEEVQIGVKDNGIGMEQQHISEIFQPFFRLHPKAYPGSGIGLAACKKIAAAHQGEIWARSTPSSGTHFFLTLPLALTGGCEAQ